jgi:Holliday junction DNA helicase RuvA
VAPDARLYIHTAVRDDAIDLYGFLEEAELVFFKQLMGVSGIGPKTALGIMSVADVSSLKRAVAEGDSVTLIKVYGIGKKSAERLVVELRDKVSLEIGVGSGSTATGDGDVIEALLSLGYRADESRKALKEVAPGTVGTKARLAAVLRHLGSK